MYLHPAWVSLGLFSSAFPFCYSLNNVAALHQPAGIFFIGFAVLIALCAMVYYYSSQTKEPLLHVFMVLSFTSGIHAAVALEQEGYISNYVEFYLKEGESYLNSAYGTMTCSWHAVVHGALYLLMILAIEQRKSYRNFGLYWVGSFVMTLMVFLLGNLVGKYGSEIQPAFLVNVPDLVVSIWAARRIFKQPKALPLMTADKISEEQRKSLLQRPLDLGLLAFLIFAIVFTLFRGLVVLDCPADMCFDYVYQQEPYLRDPVAYPKVQMLVYLFYALPYFCVCIYGLLSPGCSWMPDWALIFAGAIAQAQFCHIGCSLHHRTPFPYRAPQEAWWFVVLTNLAYAVGPQVLVYRCLRQPAFFCHPVAHDADKKSR